MTISRRLLGAALGLILFAAAVWGYRLIYFIALATVLWTGREARRWIRRR
jgi:hypothetical protein